MLEPTNERKSAEKCLEICAIALAHIDEVRLQPIPNEDPTPTVRIAYCTKHSQADIVIRDGPSTTPIRTTGQARLATYISQ